MRILLATNCALFFVLMTVGNFCFAADCNYFCCEDGIKGNGRFITKSYDFTNQPFDSVSAMDVGEIDIYVTSEPDTTAVLITTDSNLISYIDIYVKGKTLFLSKKGNASIKSTKIKIVVNTSELQFLATHGTCIVVAHNIRTNVFHAESYGASKIDLHGNAKILSLEASGASKISTTSLVAEEVDIDCSGTSTVSTRAIRRLNVDVSGVCKVSYVGSPEEVKKHVSGLGKITHY